MTGGELGRIPDELASALSHELRTPLAVIRGYAEIVELRADEDTRTEAARRIQEAVASLEAKLDALLAARRRPE